MSSMVIITDEDLMAVLRSAAGGEVTAEELFAQAVSKAAKENVLHIAPPEQGLRMVVLGPEFIAHEDEPYAGFLDYSYSSNEAAVAEMAHNLHERAHNHYDRMLKGRC